MRTKMTKVHRLNSCLAVPLLATFLGAAGLAHAEPAMVPPPLKLDLAYPGSSLAMVDENCDEPDVAIGAPAMHPLYALAPASAIPPARLTPSTGLASTGASAGFTSPSTKEPVAAQNAPASSPSGLPEPARPTMLAQAHAPAAVPAKVATIDVAGPATSWEIVPADKTLNAALARWAAVAGWQLVWELPVDYAVEARTTVPGTFQEAVSLVAKSMESAEIPLKAIFYQGNKVLRIVAKGVE